MLMKILLMWPRFISKTSSNQYKGYFIKDDSCHYRSFMKRNTLKKYKNALVFMLW